MKASPIYRKAINAVDLARPRCGCRLDPGAEVWQLNLFHVTRTGRVTYRRVVECCRCGASWTWGLP